MLSSFTSRRSKTVASLPSFCGEWASEKETILRSPSADIHQFMAGSEDNPVSIAYILGESSSKHSSMESKPETLPYKEKCGVQAWAGMIKQRSLTPRAISATALAVSPTMGRPSERRLAPLRVSSLLMAETTSKPGAKIRVWIFLTFPPCE